MQTPQADFLHRDPIMNETALGCQPIAGQRQLPQSSDDNVAGTQARSGQPVLRALARQRDTTTLLDNADIPAHATLAASRPGSENVAGAPRLAPQKAESEPESPSPHWLAELYSDLNKDVIQAIMAANQAHAPSQPGPDNVGAAPCSAPREAEPESESPPPRWLAKLSPGERDEEWRGAAGGLDENLIQTMLASRLVDVNARNANGDTGLHLAVREGDPDIIRLLLGSARIDINARNAHGRTPLHLAVIDYAYESVFDLVGCDRTDVNAEDKEGWTALRWAARHGRESLVKVLLRAPAIAVNAADARGWTALRHAAEGRHVKVVRMLLSHPCIRIPLQSQDDWNILQWAFDSNLCELVLELIRSHGAEPELGTKEPRHVFLVAAEQGKTEMVRALLALPGLDVNMVACENVDSYGDFSALVLAAMNGHLDTVQALLEAPGIDLNFGYRHGGTALSFAAGSHHLPVVLRLLAEPHVLLANSDDEDYWDLLHWVVEEGHTEVLRAALATEDAANMLTRDDGDELTPLGVAVHNYSQATSIIELLLAAPGIEKDATGCEYALAWAAEQGHLAAAERLLSLLDCAEDINSIGHALGVAADNGHMAIVHALLTVPGIDLNENYYDYPALEIAVADDNVELAHTLAAYHTFDLSQTDLQRVVEDQRFSLLQALLGGPVATSPARHEAAWQALCIAVAQNCPDAALSAMLDAGCDPIAMLDAADATEGSKSDDSAEDEKWEMAAREALHGWLLQRAAGPGTPFARLHATLQPAFSMEVENASQALIAGQHDLATLTLSGGTFSSKLLVATRLANATALGFALGHYRSLADEDALASDAERMLKRGALWPLFLEALQDFRALQDDIDRYGKDGQTMLTSAAQGGDLARMDVLIGLGARLNMPAADGDMPLMAAVKAGQWDAAIKLLNLGARHALADRQARSLAFHACKGFAQVTDPRQADRAATLIEMLLDKNVAFDQVNPDPQSRARCPTLADLLVSNPQSLVYLASFQGTSMPSGANPARTQRLVWAIVDNTGRRGVQHADRRLGAHPAS
jgi:ankyrin repeat protein